MKTNFGVIIIAISLLLSCGGNVQQENASSQDDKIYIQRMTGCSESVNGIIYVMAGMTMTDNLSEVGAYNILTKKWEAKASIPTPRSLASSEVYANDIYIFGGRNGNNILSIVEKYSTTENKWSTCATMAKARWSLMTCETNDTIYAFGGISGAGNNRKALDIVEAYNPVSNSWKSIGKMPESRQGAAIAVVNGLIYIISGKIASYAETTSGDQITDNVYSFNPKTKEWALVSAIPTGRTGAKAVVANGAIFVVGGVAISGDFPTAIDVFDPLLNKWSTGPNLSSGRSGHMCVLQGDSIIIIGGTSSKTGEERSICNSMETINISEYPKK